MYIYIYVSSILANTLARYLYQHAKKQKPSMCAGSLAPRRAAPSVWARRGIREGVRKVGMEKCSEMWSQRCL